MPFDHRIQTTGIRVHWCECGAVSVHKVHPQRSRMTCRSCKGVFIIGNLILRVAKGRQPLPPADQAIPRAELSADLAARAALGLGQSAIDPLPILPSDLAEELTLSGGQWYSADPVTIAMPRDLPELWLDRQSQQVYCAKLVAMGTRYCVQPVEAAMIDRWFVGAREWRNRCRRLTDDEAAKLMEGG
jgi:hypothetical protein